MITLTYSYTTQIEATGYGKVEAEKQCGSNNQEHALRIMSKSEGLLCNQKRWPSERLRLKSKGLRLESEDYML